MDTAQWTQEINGVVVKGTEDEMDPNSRCSSKGMLEGRKVVRAEKEQALNCPRCNSTNTKFCYYNNYSLTQPRYFCKTCRRYWTEGGSLRNVPVGGGSRKINKQQRSSSSSSSSSHKVVVVPDLNPPITLSQFSCQNNSKTTHEGQYLNLGFQAAATQEQEQEQKQEQEQHHAAGVSQFLKLPKIENNINTTSTNCTWQVSALEMLKTGNIGSSSGLNSFVSTLPMQQQLNSNTLYTPLPLLFPFQEFKPNLNFFADHGTSTRFGNSLQENGTTTTTGRLMFPFGSSLKESPNSTSELVDQNKGPAGNYTGHYYWNGMFGGR